jgi:hypothetical protein
MRHKQITQLTPEKEALIPIIRDEWIRIGLDTTPIDPQKAKDAIALAYKSARLKPPQQILWFNNPLQALTYIASEPELSKEAIRAAVGAAVFNTAFNTVRAAVGEGIRYAIEDAIAEAVEAAVEDTVFNVEMAVKEAVGATLTAPAKLSAPNAPCVEV